MPISTYRALLMRAEEMLAQGSPLHCALEDVPLDVIGHLYLFPNKQFPRLMAALPVMPPEEVQRSWTGCDGQTLMQQSCVFMKTVVGRYEKVSGRRISDATVLDFGCGWGRLSRLLLRYLPAGQIWALDAWKGSLDWCVKASLPVHIALCDERPSSLPVGDTRFDFVFGFSVFTHLSERCGLEVLETLRRYVKPEALVALTIRPAEYWHIHTHLPEGKKGEDLVADHERDGFVFVPHLRTPVDGETTFGDTSLSLDHIARRWDRWRVVGTDLNLVDPYQVIVYLMPAG